MPSILVTKEVSWTRIVGRKVCCDKLDEGAPILGLLGRFRGPNNRTQNQDEQNDRPPQPKVRTPPFPDFVP